MPASDKTVKNFLQTLAENNRLSILAGVCEKFGVLMAASKGEVEMVVTSADKLDNKTLSRLEAAVSKSAYVGQGKKLKVTNKVCHFLGGNEVVGIWFLEHNKELGRRFDGIKRERSVRDRLTCWE